MEEMAILPGRLCPSIIYGRAVDPDETLTVEFPIRTVSS
jgi:hypothetical protein